MLLLRIIVALTIPIGIMANLWLSNDPLLGLLVIASIASAVGMVTSVPLIWAHNEVGRRWGYMGLICSMALTAATGLSQASYYLADNYAPGLQLELDDADATSSLRSESVAFGQPVVFKGYLMIYGLERATGLQTIYVSETGRFLPDGSFLKVEVASEGGWDLYWGPLVVSGTLQLNPDFVPGEDLPRYILTNGVVRRARSPFGLKERESDDFC
jgi:hypothetical protein